MSRRERPIAFHPQIARELGDVESAIFYQQIWYWSDKGDSEDGFIYKSVPEIEEETTLSKYQQTRVIRKLVKKGWLLFDKRKGRDGRIRRYFKPQYEIVVQGKKLDWSSQETSLSSITENTTDIKKSAEADYSLEDINTDQLDGSDDSDQKKQRAFRTKSTKKLIDMVEKRRGARFPSRTQQMAAVNRMLDAGIKHHTIGRRWENLRKEEYWVDNNLVPDMSSVESSFNKRPPEKKEL